MIRVQRSIHQWTWATLGFVTVTMFLWALYVRRPPPPEERPVPVEVQP